MTAAIDVRDLLKAASQPGSALAGPAPGAAHDGGRPVSPLVLLGLVRALEIALILAVGLLLRRSAPVAGLPDTVLLAAIVGAAVLAGLLLHMGHAYRVRALRRLGRALRKIFIGWTVAVLLVAAGLAAAGFGGRAADLWLAEFYAAGLAALLAARLALHVFIRPTLRAGVFDRWTAIVGGGPAGEDVIRALDSSEDSGVRIVGVFDDRNVDRSSSTVAGYPKLGNVDDLVSYARRNRVDLIVFTVPITAEARILQMLAKLWVLPIDIRLSAHASKLRLRPRAYSYLGKVPVLDVFDRPLGDWDVIVKSMFDRAIALVALIVLSPAMIGVALAVKLTSRGPALFRQKRHGFNNELIEVFKFRSMYVDQNDAGAAKLVTKGDPRVTRVGRFIRKTSLDELPQLFNVLKGDLSLVGPRPHALQAKAANTLYDQVVDGYFARHKVKPGMTGWAQINGWRGETDTEEKLQRRVEHDLYYIENWSILFDLEIMARTPLSLLKSENAY
jgi:Undecaprenyl-phosphate glucose phosphotransferase